MQDIEVIKIGGSLLDLEGLADRILAIISESQFAKVLCVVGGGAAADHVRQFDQVQHIGSVAGHWAAVGAMRLNTNLLQQAISVSARVHVIESVNALKKKEAFDLNLSNPGDEKTIYMVDPTAWLMHDESVGHAIPKDWQFTSDSISAHIATRVQATRLTLLKSRSIELPYSVTDATTSGLVDRYFESVSEGISRVDLINLRAQSPCRITLKYRS